MKKLNNCLKNKDYTNTPVWFMRQAGRYLKEFRDIRKKNPDFIKLCLNKNLVNEISLQPLKRFDIDAVIVFSDILIIPYGLGQDVSFKKNFGPLLKEIDSSLILNTTSESFLNKINEVYNGLKLIKKNIVNQNKSLIGFAGSPWTLLVYMLHKQSPKKDFNVDDIFKDKVLLKKLLLKLEEFICLHIDKQIEAGADVIQIFDSWAGLLSDNDLVDYCYKPNLKIVDHVKKKGVPIICFPRGINKENYLNFCSLVKPSAISIDYNIDIKWIREKLDNIPVQGGMDPKILLTNKQIVEKEVNKYLDIFSDYPYIFNLGHGVLPDTDPSMIEFVINIIRNKK